MERLASFIKNSINCTKSELLVFHHEQRIKVNGTVVSLQTKLEENDVVTFDEKVLKRIPLVYYMYNKPIGVTCTNNKDVDSSISNIIDIKERVYPVGRLDKNSHGLLLLTNDGDFTHSILENPEIDKEYIVKLEKPVTDTFLKGLVHPITIKGKITNEAIVEKIDEKTIRVILNDGKYHQVRRLVQYQGNKVIDLYRVRIGKYKIDGLKEGEIKSISIN